MGYSVFPELLFLTVFCPVFVWFNVKGKGKDAQKLLKLLWTVGLIVYSAVLIWEALISRQEGYSHSLNFEVFSSYKFILIQYNSFDVLKQIIDNVLVFVPLGMLLPAAYQAKHETKSYAFVVFAGFVMSLIIEVLQYAFSIGFTEIDDLINNTIGTVIGCGFYALTDRIESKKDSIVFKKGWLKCLSPALLYYLMFGAIWCFREFILIYKQ